MELTCDRTALNTAINLAQRAVVKNILGREERIVLIPSLEGTLKVVGNNPNYGYFITISVEINGGENTEPLILDASMLSKIVKRGKNPLVKIVCSNEDYNVKIKNGSFVSKLRRSNELPFTLDSRFGENEEIFHIPSDILCKLLTATCWASAQDNKKPNYKVCQLVIDKGEKLIARATDSYVIAIAEEEFPSNLGMGNIETFVPSYVGDEVSSVDMKDSTVCMAYKHISLRKTNSVGEVYLESQLMNVKYPDLNQYLKNLSFLNEITLSRDLFTDTLSRLCIQLQDNLFPVVMTYKDKTLYFDNTKPRYEFHETMPVVKGPKESFKCAFDIKKVLSALKGTYVMNEDDKIKFHYCGDQKPIVISTDNYFAYVMMITTPMLDKNEKEMG